MIWKKFFERTGRVLTLPSSPGSRSCSKMVKEGGCSPVFAELSNPGGILVLLPEIHENYHRESIDGKYIGIILIKPSPEMRNFIII